MLNKEMSKGKTMKVNLKLSRYFGLPHIAITGVLLLLTSFNSARAQTVTSDPADGATGVSVNGPIIFTFSSAVDPAQTFTAFTSTTGGFYLVNSTWSSGNTVLTCTPTSPFPTNTTIDWSVIVNVTPMPVISQGSFTTGTKGGGGSGGSGTNAITTFSVGKLYLYQQTNASLPSVQTNFAYGFIATVGLESNITATAVTVKIPNASSATGLSQNFLAHEDYYFYDYNNTSQTTFESTYPQGAYPFTVTGNSNLQVTVTMPTTMQQPNAPHISNFAATQTIDPTKPFTFTWDAFTGGTSSDYIGFSVNDDKGVAFHTPYLGTNDLSSTNKVLTGTATSVLMPANTLSANSNYTAQLIFYRFVAVSNSTYATIAYRASGTDFNVITKGTSSAVTPVVSNPVWSGTSIGFDVQTTPNQPLKVRFSTDCSLPIAQWQTILNTNSPGTSVHITIPPQAGKAGFFRLQNGP